MIKKEKRKTKKKQNPKEVKPEIRHQNLKRKIMIQTKSPL